MALQFKVYVLYSMAHDKLFAGLTSSLTDRMLSHNGDDPEDWTSAFKPWILVHMELFDDEYEAMSRESFLESPNGQAYIRSDILALYDF